jgi:flagellar hook-associated protein 1 FlgK
MSLFGSIQMGGNTLRAMQIGLQVVGNNIANAATPGYVRQEAVFVPGPLQRIGHLILGTGVLVDSIVAKLDRLVQDRMVGALGDRANAELQAQVYLEVEGILNALSDDASLGGAMTRFFNSIEEVMKAPGDIPTRNLAVDAGVDLARNINDLYGRVLSVREQLDDRVTTAADEINSLTEEIQRLNLQIASTEGGDTSGSVAGSLRVQRQAAIDRLSEILGIRVVEQPSGGVSVAIGGEFLVFEGQRREVQVSTDTDSGIGLRLVEFADTRSTLENSSGELAGLYAARDEIAGGVLKRLDMLAATLAFEFNKVYAQGQGLVGYSQLTSVALVEDADTALDVAGLAFTPVSGALDVLVHNKENDITTTQTILIRLDGLDSDTSLADLAQQLDAIDGLAASVSASGKLQLSAESPDVEFAFDGDTSGVLAALGLNTFFTGSSATTIGVNEVVADHVALFAASGGGIGRDEDAANAELLAALMDEPLESAGNVSLADLYRLLISDVGHGSAVAQSLADGLQGFENALAGQQQAVSGVSIDEEAIKMITLQRIYQASARYIQAISELLDVLVNL